MSKPTPPKLPAAKPRPPPLPRSSSPPGVAPGQARLVRPALERMNERNLPDAEVRQRFGKPLDNTRRRNLRFISKEMSYMLRHGAQRAGLVMRHDGFVSVGPLLRTMMDKHRITVTMQDLYDIVGDAEKTRFELKEGTKVGGNTPELTHIRAISGHSIADVNDEELLGPPVSASDLPTILYHGTMQMHLESILARGVAPRGAPLRPSARPLRSVFRVGARRFRNHYRN